MKQKIILIIGILAFIIFMVASVIFYNSYVNNSNSEMAAYEEITHNTITNVVSENTLETAITTNIVNEAISETIENTTITNTSSQETKNNTEKKVSKSEQNTQSNKNTKTSTNQPTQPTQSNTSKNSQAQQSTQNKKQGTTTSSSTNTSQQPVVKKKTLLYFGAIWCGPCKVMKPIIEEIASEMSSTVIVKKYDIDENPEMVSKYSIYSIPTMIILEDGKITNRFVGQQSKSTLVNALK